MNPGVLKDENMDDEDGLGDIRDYDVVKRDVDDYNMRKMDGYDEDEARGEAKTFEELFGGVFESQMREEESMSDVEVEKWHVNMRVEKIKEKTVEKGGLHHAESIFASLFKKQSKWSGDDAMMLHKMAREGWRAMINGYVLQGTEKQLKWFLETYSAMYGLHPIDQSIIIIKFHLSHNDIEKAQYQWEKSNQDGMIDDRGFSIMAKGYSNQNQFKMAYKILDDAWMIALSDNQFKITPVFYQTSAEIYISSINIPRLTDLFIRLKANQPPLNSRFFTILFRTLNSLTGISGRISTMKNMVVHQDNGNGKDMEFYESDEEDGKKLEKNKEEEKSSSSPSNPSISPSSLSKMFDMIESCLNKFSIHPSTQLRNEMLAFKLYAESDASQMFKLLSQYATSPDIRTLNMMLDALIHEGKIQMASLLSDSWDAQYGVKMDSKSNTIISNYLIDFSNLPIPNLNGYSSILSSNSSNSSSSSISYQSFSSIYSIPLPPLSLFDELILRRPSIFPSTSSLIAFSTYLSKLELQFPKPSPASSLLVSYIISREYDIQRTSCHRFYGVAQAFFNHQNPIAGKQICDFAETLFKHSKKIHPIRSLRMQWAHTFETLEETEAKWIEWKREIEEEWKNEENQGIEGEEEILNKKSNLEKNGNQNEKSQMRMDEDDEMKMEDEDGRLDLDKENQFEKTNQGQKKNSFKNPIRHQRRIPSTAAMGYLRALNRNEFCEAHSNFLNDVVSGKVYMTSSLFGAILRMVIKQPSKMRRSDFIFELEKSRILNRIPLNANTSSMIALIIMIDSKRILKSKRDEVKEVEMKMNPFRNSEPATQYPLPLSKDEEEEFKSAIKYVEDIIIKRKKITE